MLKPLLFSALVAFTPIIASAQAVTAIQDMPSGAYTLDQTHASVTWKVSHMGLSNYTARFTKMDATLTLDPKDITKSTLKATIDPASIKTDFPNAAEKDFDGELIKGDKWFNATKFPTITFESTKVEKTGTNTGKVTGNMTFLGVTKPLVLNVTFNGAYVQQPMMNIPAMGFSATATVKRSDWGMGNYVPMIGDDVTVLIETEFHQKK